MKAATTTMASKVRFSDAVYAINTTPKSLRLWLQRGLVDIHTPQREGGWTEYSVADIAILALVRTLVRFGVTVPVASAFANAIVRDSFPKMLKLEQPDQMPAGALATLFADQRLRIFETDDGWTYDWSPNWQPKPEPARAYLVINVEPLLREAIARAAESANEGAEED